MSRPVTLCTGQWADLPVTVLAEKASSWGYDGLELACWGDHMNVEKAASDLNYCEEHLEKLAKHNLNVYAISNHLAGQLVCDPNNDSRSDLFAPDDCAGDAEKKRAWAVGNMKKTAVAAKNLGIDVVNGFTGSPIWHYFYSFPPVSKQMIDDGFGYFAEMWNPILDVFDECGVKFALEVHPTEIAFDIVTADRAMDAVSRREAFGHPERGWDFRSLGRGDINFEDIIRTFNHIGYSGPLSVEWEDTGMDREHGAAEACDFVKQLDFQRSEVAFDAAFEE